MNRFLLFGLLGTLTASPMSTRAAPPASAPDGAPVTVVVELFTSEGCSSCPPADAVLRTLEREQSIPGVRVIALGEHVDYWNYLGWTDRFSAEAFSARQSRYQKRVFPRGFVYTPQAVVDGVTEAIGSDPAAVRKAIERAAQRAKLGVSLRATQTDGRELRVAIGLRGSADAPAEILVAVVEDGLSTEVRGGENRGRLLRHDAVVRSLETIGTLAAHTPAQPLEHSLPIDADWDIEHLRVVTFVQDRSSLAILGSTEASVERDLSASSRR